MVSIQEPGLVRLYRTEPNGNKTQISQMRVEQSAPAGGAPDGAPASVSTPEKLMTINSNVILQTDDILEVAFIADGADGLDASDAIFSIPLVTRAGSKTLGNAQFQNPAFADVTATIAGQEIILCGYRIIEGQARVAGKLFIDIQDDTA